MRKFTSFILFFLCCISSVISGYHQYKLTEARIRHDLNKALTQTLSDGKTIKVTNDTINACRLLSEQTGRMFAVTMQNDNLRHRITIKELREHTFIAYSLSPEPFSQSKQFEGALRSDTFIVGNAGKNRISLCCYAQISPAFVWDLSNQRYSFTLVLLAVACGLSAFRFNRRSLTSAAHGCTVAAASGSNYNIAGNYGDIRYDSETARFTDIHGNIIPFTPMQNQLMELFYRASSHTLSHRIICRELWPKKDDASETLYALIRRLKVVLAQHSTLTIEVDRGRGYTLKSENQNYQ